MMNKIAVFILVAAAAFSRPASAQTAEELNITVRSSFVADAASHNPFWPIGWQKHPTAPVGVPSATQAVTEKFFKPENFVVTSISINRIPLAVINGRLYGEGDPIPANPRLQASLVTRPGYPAAQSAPGVQDAGARAQIVSIRDGEVLIRFQNETVAAHIKTAGPEIGRQ